MEVVRENRGGGWYIFRPPELVHFHSAIDNRIRLLVWGLILVIVLASCYMFIIAERNLFVVVKKPDVKRIATITNIRFPASSKVVNSCLIGEYSLELYGEITMDKEDVAEFTEQFSTQDRKSELATLSFLKWNRPNVPDWWRIGNPKRYEAFERRSMNSTNSHIVVDLDSYHHATVYIYKLPS